MPAWEVHWWDVVIFIRVMDYHSWFPFGASMWDMNTILGHVYQAERLTERGSPTCAPTGIICMRLQRLSLTLPPTSHTDAGNQTWIPHVDLTSQTGTSGEEKIPAGRCTHVAIPSGYYRWTSTSQIDSFRYGGNDIGGEYMPIFRTKMASQRILQPEMPSKMNNPDGY